MRTWTDSHGSYGNTVWPDQPKPAQEMERVADILSYISPPMVFFAVGKSTVNFWVLQKGND